MNSVLLLIELGRTWWEIYEGPYGSSDDVSCNVPVQS